jgi:N,N'-diacetylchitobiose phosphorylase
LKIGSHENEEGKVFLESNCLGGGFRRRLSRERGISCMNAVDKYLFSEYGIHLAWPAFSKPNDDIGFIGRVYKGVKEKRRHLQPPQSLGHHRRVQVGPGRTSHEVL